MQPSHDTSSCLMWFRLVFQFLFRTLSYGRVEGPHHFCVVNYEFELELKFQFRFVLVLRALQFQSFRELLKSRHCALSRFCQMVKLNMGKALGNFETFRWETYRWNKVQSASVRHNCEEQQWRAVTKIIVFACKFQLQIFLYQVVACVYQDCFLSANENDNALNDFDSMDAEVRSEWNGGTYFTNFFLRHFHFLSGNSIRHA